MEKKLVVKMIRNCFKQYHESDLIPISNSDLEELATRILKAKEKEAEEDLFEVVNDVVYEFLTK
ncbi:YqzH family protein [Neobacillus mesonae]|uniref:YqzH family protein n=1 Tax=Neobacillus mesonae TaxID=1193713 RepID=UPI002040455B|nr:YqzH family protein [Neobacillus mesonae]MCM3566706.1 YqzH family protein [Neobacillus mesonae]